VGNCQSLVWERTIDLSTSNLEGNSDAILDLCVQDSNNIFINALANCFSIPTPNGRYQRPILLKANSQGILIDTIIVEDTVFGYRFTLDRLKKRLWMIFQTQNYPYGRLVFQKINFQGFTLARRDFWLDSSIPDSLSYDIMKLVPSNDGGFYILATMSRNISGQSSDLWQVSRWDSLGNRRWVKEYLYTYAYGQPQQAEFLPNGNLFVSGWAGREIMALEIDTATGRAVNRKVLYTHPENTGWFTTGVKRCPGGYLISAYDSRNSSSVNRYFFGKFNDTLGRVWGARSSSGMGTMITPLVDSTFWIGTKSGNRTLYQRMGPDSTVLQTVVLSVDNPGESTGIGFVGHFTNLSAVFGGSTTRRTTRGSALYLCKIDSIGTPYNPVYPPVGPVPVATKNRIVEPDLQVFPNPFTHTLRISHRGTLQLLDIHGRKVMAQAVEAGQEINTVSLPRGMYLLRFTSAAGKGYARKVVRE